jgi:hypothetical protein
MNEELKKIYEIYLQELKEKQLPETTSAPLLMHVFEEYELCATKILIIGQETNGWGCLKDLFLDDLLKDYNDFALGQNANFNGCYQGKSYLTSPFWNFSRSFFKNITHLDRKNKGFLWTNISKFDINCTTPPEELLNANPEGFWLLKKEIEIIKPDITIFLTGQKYDLWMKEYLGVSFDEIYSNEKTNIHKVMDRDGFLPLKSYKVAHPNTLYWAGQYKIILNELLNICS